MIFDLYDSPGTNQATWTWTSIGYLVRYAIKQDFDRACDSPSWRQRPQGHLKVKDTSAVVVLHGPRVPVQKPPKQKHFRSTRGQGHLSAYLQKNVDLATYDGSHKRRTKCIMGLFPAMLQTFLVTLCNNYRYIVHYLLFFKLSNVISLLLYPCEYIL